LGFGIIENSDQSDYNTIIDNIIFDKILSKSILIKGINTSVQNNLYEYQLPKIIDIEQDSVDINNIIIKWRRSGYDGFVNSAVKTYKIYQKKEYNWILMDSIEADNHSFYSGVIPRFSNVLNNNAILSIFKVEAITESPQIIYSSYPDSLQDDRLVGIPSKYELFQNYPNPFNSNTHIRYGLATDSDVKITLYNILGEKIKVLLDDKKIAGFHTVEFDAGNISSGIYFYRVEASKFHDTKKMVLLN